MAQTILDVVDYFQRLPAATDKAVQLAINTVANRSGLKMARDEIMQSIAFPKDYLTGDRLKVKQNAKPGNLEAIIAARRRPTSLARFADAGTNLGSRAKIGVRIQVKRGNTVTLKQSWLTRLNNGNIGLAVRLKPGQSIGNKTGEVSAWLVPGKVALLYGPSVDQVFREVSLKIAGPVGRKVSEEFFRQFARLTQ